MASKDVDNLARKIWNYHHVNHKLEKAECIFVLGGPDLRVAEYGAKLFLDGYAPVIIFSGGIAHQGDLLETGWKKPEAEVFAEKAMELGVPKDRIIIENKATNTGENVRFTEKILKEKGLNFESFIVVQKPWMERRAYATIKVYWPNKKVIVTSSP
ncbi:MAG: YdcF family protein, partial [Nanoarchaeota archaeon]